MWAKLLTANFLTFTNPSHFLMNVDFVCFVVVSSCKIKKFFLLLRGLCFGCLLNVVRRQHIQNGDSLFLCRFVAVRWLVIQILYKRLEMFSKNK